MTVTLRLALLVLIAAVPVRAELVRLPAATKVVPGQYVVLDAAGKGLGGLAAVHAETVRELPLRNFPAGRVVRMSPEMAELVAREGYTVIPEFLMPLLAEPPVQVQGQAPWHLDRSDQRTFPLDSTYRYSYTGRGVRVYVLDSAVFRNPDIAESLEPGVDFVGDGLGVYGDCGSPGTHATGVISVLAGKRYGVAKGVRVVPVRVSDCGGHVRLSSSFAGLDWALSDARKYSASRAVVNMSFGEVGANVYDQYFKKLDAAGIVLVDAAGNGNIDACRYAPASSRYTITAGGTNIRDAPYQTSATGGSNWGKCVDIFAPGQNVPNAGGLNDQEWFGTGTSGSAPQVAGHVAQLLEQFPRASPGLVRKLLVAKATPGLLGNLGKGSPNLLLHTGPFQEAFTQLLPRWFPGERRFTLQLLVTVPGGGLSPAERVSLYRGPAKDGRCQGQPFATATLAQGAATVTVRGWKQAPAFVCAETSLGAVAEAAVRTL